MKCVLAAAVACLCLVPVANPVAAQDRPDESSSDAVPTATAPQTAPVGPQMPSLSPDTGGRVEDITTLRGEGLPYVRRLEDVVQLDLDDVDLEADVILTVDGEPITRNEFRRRAIMYAGLAEFDQLVTNLITLDEIERRVAAGADRSEFMLSEEDIDRRIEETKDLIRMQTQQTFAQDAQQAGVEETPPEALDEAGNIAIAQFEKSIEESVGWDAYRDMLGVEASFEKVFLPLPTEPTGEEVHDPTTGPVPDDDPKPEWLPQITWDALGIDDQAKTLRQFVKTSGANGAEIHAMFRGQVINTIRKGILQQVGLRYFFDEEMPDELFARVGDHDVTVDQVWAMQQTQFVQQDIDIILRELLTLRAMERALEAEGAWFTPEQAQLAFDELNAQFEGTLLPLDAIIIFRGYSSAARFREHFRYRSAYDAWKKANMTEDELEAHYRGGGRLFFQRGTALVDVAYQGTSSIGGYTPEAFEKASAMLLEKLAGNEAEFQAIATADFPPPVTRTPLGAGGGRALQRNQLRMKLTESELSIFLTGYSLADDIFYNGMPGEVFGPWAETCRRHAWGAELNAGSWMVKLDGFTSGRSLAPLEEREYATAESDYLDLQYLWWSQEQLKDLLSRTEVAGS